jgi:hypothetical protein
LQAFVKDVWFYGLLVLGWYGVSVSTNAGFGPAAMILGDYLQACTGSGFNGKSDSGILLCVRACVRELR